MWHLPFVLHLGNKAAGLLYLGWYESFPCEEVFLITTQHIWVLLGVLKVKLILEMKVKNPTLVEVGGLGGKMFPIRENETLNQKIPHRTKLKEFKREKITNQYYIK